MNRINYQLQQILFKIRYRKKEYFMYIVSFYLGLLLPAFCLANIRSVDQVIYFTTFENMERSVQIGWFSDNFLDIKMEDAESISVSGYYEEDFVEWGHQYVTIKGIDEYFMYPFPKVKGRMFENDELREGKKVCLLNQKYAEKYSYKKGDLLSIHNVDFEIIGFIKDKIYPGILIPYAAMKEVCRSGNGIQFTATVLAENEGGKESIIEKSTETILDQDKNAEIIEITDGEELYGLSQETKLKWRFLRGAVACVSVIFFLLNEGIVLMEKIKKEQPVIGVRMAVGATREDVRRGLLLETLIITLLAAGMVLITILPLARLFGVDEIIILDVVVIAEFLVVAVSACELLSYMTIRKIKSRQIAVLMKTRDE